MFNNIRKHICALSSTQQRLQTTIYKHWAEHTLTNHSWSWGLRSSIYGKRGGVATLLLRYVGGNGDAQPIRAHSEESGRFIYVDVFKGCSFTFLTSGCVYPEASAKKGGCKFVILGGILCLWLHNTLAWEVNTALYDIANKFLKSTQNRRSWQFVLYIHLIKGVNDFQWSHNTH